MEKKENIGPVLKAYTLYANKFFKVNVCLFDFVYWEEMDECELSFNPCDVVTSFWKSDIIKPPRKAIDMYDYFGRIFFILGSSLTTPGIELDLVLSAGDMHVKLSCLSEKFHRITARYFNIVII